MKYVLIIVIALFAAGCAEQLAETEVYDPNSPQFKYLEVAEPNWVAAFGDTLETRKLYNISKNRIMTAMIAKRLLALENPVEPNAVAEVDE